MLVGNSFSLTKNKKCVPITVHRLMHGVILKRAAATVQLWRQAVVHSIFWRQQLETVVTVWDSGTKGRHCQTAKGSRPEPRLSKYSGVDPGGGRSPSSPFQ